MFIVNGKGSIITLIAGIFVFSSVLLGLFVHKNFLYFTAFVGCMLMLSATTGFCPMELILKLTKLERRKTSKA
ncbi:MAG: DUF2892 domain-containing protein [Spirochaetia bacterium]|nr:DUF2892 domain-containing protein [Spirochaetia bacterium]